MFGSVLIKFLLILLLPSILVALYFEGQRYEPALLDFQSIPKTSLTAPVSDEVLSSKNLKSLSGYSLIGKEKGYTKDNLYEHVNGHAEYFIGMGFKKLTVYEYSQKGSQPDIQVEVFDMGKPLQAFGVLMDAVGSTAVSIDIGSVGYQTHNAIVFIKGNNYVRVISYKKGIRISNFAKEFASLLPSSTINSFNVFAKIPKLGQLISTRYIKEGYKGMDFLNHVIERQYEFDGLTFQVAFLLAETHEIQKIVNSAIDFLKKTGATYQRLEYSNSEVLKIHDDYEGNWVMIRLTDSLVCLFGEINDEIIKKVANVK